MFKVINGGYEKTLDGLFASLLADDFEGAQRIKQEEIMPRQAKRPILTEVSCQPK